MRTIEQVINQDLNKIDELSIIINNNKPFFEEKDYDIREGVPKYFEPDEYGRSSGAIAIISNNTLSIRTEKYLTYPDPNGWTKIIEKSGIFQRCHCIAYRLSAKFTDKDNIFIGTVNLNKKVMGDIERDIEKYIRENEIKEFKILYRVTPIYKAQNQIPTGVLLEAKGINCNLSKCIFCYNIEKDVEFDYIDGRIIDDKRSIVSKGIEKLKRNYTKRRQSREGNIKFVINTRAKRYHLFDKKCSKLNNINPKYIKEIKTKESKLISQGFFPCKKCNE